MVWNRFCYFWPFITMKIIETQINSQINFKKYEMRGKIYRVKQLWKYVIYGGMNEHKICFGVFWSHANRFRAWRRRKLRTMTTAHPLTPPPPCFDWCQRFNGFLFNHSLFISKCVCRTSKASSFNWYWSFLFERSSKTFLLYMCLWVRPWKQQLHYFSWSCF